MASAFSVFWINRRIPTSRYNYKKYRDKFTSVEFKPMKGISLEEYIYIKNDSSLTTVPAVLTELDRQGKIELTSTRDKRFLGKKVIISVKNPDTLSDSECNFLYALKKYQPTTRGSEISRFLHKFITEDIDSHITELWFSPEEINHVRDKKNPWSTIFRTNATFETNPIRYLFSNGKIRESLESKGMFLKMDKKEAHREMFAFECVTWLPLFLTLVPATVSLLLGPKGFLFTYNGEIPEKTFAILGAIIMIIPIITGVVLSLRLNIIRKYQFYSPEALDVLHYYDGLKRYMEKVEINQINFHQDKTNSEFLELTPYAILFGLEKTWSKRFRFALYNN